MKRLIAVVLLLMLTLPVVNAQDATGLTGTYTVQGVDADGATYTCSLEIVTNGNTSQWRWSGCGEFSGIGLQEDRIVSVISGDGDCTLGAYHINEMMSLVYDGYD